MSFFRDPGGRLIRLFTPNVDVRARRSVDETSAILWAEVDAHTTSTATELSMDIEFLQGGGDVLLTLYIDDEQVMELALAEIGLTNKVNWDGIELPTPKMGEMKLGFRLDSVSGSRPSVEVSNVEFHGSTPAPGKRLTSNAWEQISLPAQGVPIFQGLENEVYGESWVIFTYDPVFKKYTRLGGPDDMVQGVGYWVIQTTGREVTIYMPEEAKPTTVIHNTRCSTARCYSVPLIGGELPVWNLSGYPFSASQPFDNLRVSTTAGTCSGGCDAKTAESENIMHDVMWHYNSSDNEYNVISGDALLNAWDGYWLAVLPGSGAAGTELNLSER